MSGLKLFFAILVFVLYQVAVWFLIRQAAPAGVALPVCIFLTACGNTLLALYFVALQQPSQTPSSFVPPAFIQPAPKHPAGKTNPEIGWDAGEAAPALEPLPAQTEPPSLLIAEAQKQLGRPVISDLPVHLLIGIEGCGKTSLIRSSGFAATHLAGQSAPPRNAWLVGDSLLLEQGGPASWADAVESRNLLEALGRQPRLAGVTVCCPIDPFLGVQDARALGALATRVQAHLREIGAATGDPVSFCLVFTKCDSIPFFADYCGVLADSERQQVLGSALPDLSGQPREMQAKQITDAFNVLYLSLAEKRLTLLSRSAATATRAGIYEFPREMRRMR